MTASARCRRPCRDGPKAGDAQRDARERQPADPRARCEPAREPGADDHAAGADGEHDAADGHIEAGDPHEIVGNQEQHAERGEVHGNAGGVHDGEIDVAEERRPDDGLGVARSRGSRMRRSRRAPAAPGRAGAAMPKRSAGTEKASSSALIQATSRTAPTASKPRAEPRLGAVGMRPDSARATSTSGARNQNTAFQSQRSTRKPPTRGPRAEPAAVMAA